MSLAPEKPTAHSLVSSVLATLAFVRQVEPEELAEVVEGAGLESVEIDSLEAVTVLVLLAEQAGLEISKSTVQSCDIQRLSDLVTLIESLSWGMT